MILNTGYIDGVVTKIITDGGEKETLKMKSQLSNRQDRQTGVQIIILTVNRWAFIEPPSEPVRIWLRTTTAEGNTRLKTSMVMIRIGRFHIMWE